ncbi:hypothetical protein D3C77_430520 [compost metagenome]
MVIVNYIYMKIAYRIETEKKKKLWFWYIYKNWTVCYLIDVSATMNLTKVKLLSYFT